MNFIHDPKIRQWIYGVAAAVLVLLAGYGFFTAEEQENILNVIVAVLNLGGSAGFVLAGANARPSERDDVAQRGKYGDYSDTE